MSSCLLLRAVRDFGTRVLPASGVYAILHASNLIVGAGIHSARTKMMRACQVQARAKQVQLQASSNLTFTLI